MRCEICESEFDDLKKHVQEFHNNEFARIHDSIIRVMGRPMDSVAIMKESTTTGCDHDPMVMALEGSYKCPRCGRTVTAKQPHPAWCADCGEDDGAHRPWCKNVHTLP